MQGNQSSGERTPERKRNRAVGVVPARSPAAAHAARRHRIRFQRSAYDIRRDRSEVLDLPRRDSADEEARVPGGRSEEHTSELQSRENLVCRLLLEKKKNR